jgi:hypothetical protein
MGNGEFMAPKGVEVRYLVAAWLGKKETTMRMWMMLAAGWAMGMSASAMAQTTAVWVYFEDKGVGAGEEMREAIARVEREANPRQAWRRSMRRTAAGLYDERDVGICAEYRARVLATGARARVESRWLNAMSVEATEEQVEAIARLGFVARVEGVRRGRRLDGGVEVERENVPRPYGDRDFYGNASAQLAQINLVALHGAGGTGQGVIVGVLDTGFRRDHAAFHHAGHELQVIAEWDFINNDGNTGIEGTDDPDQHRHGTWILSTMGAYLPEVYVGGAYDASFVLCKTEDVTSETPVEEDYYVAGIEFIEMHGGDVATSSLSYVDWYTPGDLDGRTAVTTIAVNVATQNGVHWCTAAGNAGHDADPMTSRLGAPADALEVITCGAVDGANVIAGFSSDGPSADGRVKPELLAWGVNTQVISSRNTTGYGTVSGTSLSTPLVASAVACLASAHPNWSVTKMRNYLFATADGSGTFDGTYVRGYGLVNAYGASNAGCGADIDGDLGVTIDDLLLYLEYFESGRLLSDMDDGSGMGVPDGGVTIDDLLYFLLRFEVGC